MLASGRVVPLEAATREAILAAVDRMAASALRCLAFARRGDLGDLASYDGDQHPVRLKTRDQMYSLCAFIHSVSC